MRLICYEPTTTTIKWHIQNTIPNTHCMDDGRRSVRDVLTPTPGSMSTTGQEVSPSAKSGGREAKEDMAISHLDSSTSWLTLTECLTHLQLQSTTPWTGLIIKRVMNLATSSGRQGRSRQITDDQGRQTKEDQESSGFQKTNTANGLAFITGTESLIMWVTLWMRMKHLMLS